MKHMLDLRRFPLWGAWQARCTGCPGWEGQSELSRPAAIRHFTVHAFANTGIFA